LARGLAAVATLDTIDLVCAPDIMQGAPPSAEMVEVMQKQVLSHCDTVGDRLAILDALPGRGVDEVRQQRRSLSDINGALYYPWIKVVDGPASGGGFIPPCGHIAGIYARSDQAFGVHKAPANEVLKGAIDLECNLSNLDQERLNPEGVNCIRSFPGRGIRVWGARTLSRETAWTYVSVRRLFLTAVRWVQHNMADIVFEPNDPRLWTRIRRELNAYFNRLFERGALKGSTPQEAFYVKCDAETNPPDVRERGEVVTEIGLAPGIPSEFVVVRIIHGPSGVTIAGPGQV